MIEGFLPRRLVAAAMALLLALPSVAQVQRPPTLPPAPGELAAPPGAAPPGVPPAAAAVPAAAPRREDATWAATLERIAESVVAIEIDSTRAFDTEWNTSSQATGFVIDADKGLILTNRHVVTPGPVTSEADVPQPRGGAALSGVPRSGARLRPLPLRPVEAAVHQAEIAAAVSGGRAGRPRDPRDRQQRRRAALHPRRHAREARSRGAGLWPRPLQRLQHVLSAGRFGHLGRLVRFARRGHRRARRRAERRRCVGRGVELLSAARSREARAWS